MRIVPDFQNPVVVQTGTLATSSAVVTGLADTSLLVGGLGVTGTGVPAGTYLLSIDSATQVTLTQAATASGAHALTVVLEPITLAEAKLHLRVDIPDDDALIASLITTARITCEGLTKSALITQTRTLYLDSFPSAGGYYNRAVREAWPSIGSMPSGLGFYPGMVPNSSGVIDLPLPPLQSITSVKYYDFAGTLQTFSSAAYNVSTGMPGRIQPAYSKVWPIARPTIDAVQIAFVCGYGATAASVPEPFKAAIKLMVGSWYEHRESTSDAQTYAVPNTVELLLAAVTSGLYY